MKIFYILVCALVALNICGEVRGQSAINNDTISNSTSVRPTTIGTATTQVVTVTAQQTGGNRTSHSSETTQQITTTRVTTTAKEPTTAIQTTAIQTTTGAVKPTETTQTGGTTSSPDITTEASMMTTNAPNCPSHSFDAASFIGGIVLGLGLSIIFCLLYKWYQSKTRSGAPYQQF